MATALSMGVGEGFQFSEQFVSEGLRGSDTLSLKSERKIVTDFSDCLDRFDNPVTSGVGAIAAIALGIIFKSAVLFVGLTVAAVALPIILPVIVYGVVKAVEFYRRRKFDKFIDSLQGKGVLEAQDIVKLMTNKVAYTDCALLSKMNLRQLLQTRELFPNLGYNVHNYVRSGYRDYPNEECLKYLKLFCLSSVENVDQLFSKIFEISNSMWGDTIEDISKYMGDDIFREELQGILSQYADDTDIRNFMYTYGLRVRGD